MTELIAPVLAARIRRFFGAEAQQVIAALESYGQASHHGEIERVRSVIVELAKGNLKEIERLVESAKKDYRDVLYWHELAIKK